MQCTFDKNRAAVNLFATAPDWGSGSYVNLLTNSSFETASGTVEVYRNLVTTPRFGSGWSFGWGGGSWTASSPMTEVDPKTGQTFYFVRLTCTAPSTVLYTHTISGLTDGATYSGALELRPSANIANIGISFTGGVASRSAGVAGRWSRHEVSKVVSGTSQTINYSVETSPAVGFYVDVRFPIFVAGSKAPAYFDGSFSPDSDLAAAWVGTPNASASTLTGQRVANVTAQYSVGVQSTNANGTKSLRIISTANRTDANTFIAGNNGLVGMSGFGVTFVAGKTYTIQGWVRDTALTGALANAKRIQVIWNSQDGWTGATTVLSTTVKTVNGSRLERVTFTLPANTTAATARVFNGSAVGNEDVWWDRMVLVEGALPAGVDYWDGSTKPANVPGSSVTWTGTPHASTSTLTIPAITSAKIERLTNNTWETIRGGTPPSTGYVALSDQEMPLNQIVRYRISGYNGGTLVRRYELEADTTLEGSCTFIKVAGKPNLSTCFDVPRDRYEMTSATQGGTYDVLGGGSIGISSASGISATKLTIQALAKTDEAARALEAILESHRIVFLQPVGHTAYPEGWYFIESVSWGMRADGQKKEGRSYTLPVVRTSRPGGESAGVSGSSYRLERAKYPTYADVPDELTYFELLQGA